MAKGLAWVSCNSCCRSAAWLIIACSGSLFLGRHHFREMWTDLEALNPNDFDYVMDSNAQKWTCRVSGYCSELDISTSLWPCSPNQFNERPRAGLDWNKWKTGKHQPVTASWILGRENCFFLAITWRPSTSSTMGKAGKEWATEKAVGPPSTHRTASALICWLIWLHCIARASVSKSCSPGPPGPPGPWRDGHCEVYPRIVWSMDC